MQTEYVFDTGSDPGHVQVQCLSDMLDGTSTRILDDLGVPPGARCLDAGAGNGSIARWLADRVGPTGSVAAVDIDTTHLPPSSGVTVHAHDVDDGLPEPGPFDVVHARLLLMHLARRRDIFAEFARSLAPGGWLVVGDVSPRLPHAVTAADADDLALFDRVFETAIAHAAPAVGMNLAWAHSVPHEMAAVGLTDVGSAEHAFTDSGGGAGLRYYGSLLQQVAPVLVSHGLSEAELDRMQELVVDPRFSAWSYQFVFTWGRRPA
ncbi:class I SAM-dependent methyltransferase [Rhodococcus sp. HNM0569]|uniref:class I SAM-dependent methyltransferase n=1 Tax=Rhodococcus sp. HNM0569 TaxID=2716340 RepID=UPI00146E77BD|nr:class I SAM-dependent methyltransferase [Rhodococcus sp. HNM0569]NLU83387.1 methyltransferase domain-containing protein [Rhodococcus sp. HNM0569]